MRRFVLRRVVDVSGVSGTGDVAEGVAFSDGSVVLRWLTEWPTSVVFHDRGVEAVEQVHGHGGSTVIVWLDREDGQQPQGDRERMQSPRREHRWVETSSFAGRFCGACGVDEDDQEDPRREDCGRPL